MTLVFGPIPSRRLGRSLGLNIIPPKVCSYSCVYCQVGHTVKMTTARQTFYSPGKLVQEVADRVAHVSATGGHIDFLTFVPDGEPTLDKHLGREICLLDQFGIKIAVISNASLLWRDDVKNEMVHADWVSLKMDSASEPVWRSINRPHRSLRLSSVLHGMLDFAAIFKGTLTTETMLVRGINDSPADAGELADFLTRLAPNKAYISIPTRPPAVSGVLPPSEQSVNTFFQIVSSRINDVELLVRYEGNEFSSSGDPESDLLSITAVHPMREEAVQEYMSRANTSWSSVEHLVQQGLLVRTSYQHRTFYIRRLPGRHEE